MKYPRYPAYKDSEIGWLGDIPIDWRVDRLKWTAEGCNNGIWGEEADGSENDIICVRVADFDRQKFTVDISNPTFRLITESQRASRELKQGDLLLEKSGGGETQPVGAVVIYAHPEPAVCSNFIAKMTIRPGYDARYICYTHAMLYSLRINTKSIKQNTGIQNLDSSAYLDEKFPIPSLFEQTAIAAFLDRETTKIDILIAKQEQLIAVLQEKRQALISHAVTKGLNPDAPMKDSGVEWLGKVPAHWDILKLKRIASLKSGSGINSDKIESEGDYPVFGGNGIRGYTDQHSHEGHYALIGRQGALCGNINYAEGRFWASEHAVVVSPLANLDTKWLGEVLRSMNLNQYSISAAQPGLSVEMVSNLFVPCPSLAEQQSIATFLNQETFKIDVLAEKTKAALERLQERRTALISAAVTGKIDVRAYADG